MSPASWHPFRKGEFQQTHRTLTKPLPTDVVCGSLSDGAEGECGFVSTRGPHPASPPGSGLDRLRWVTTGQRWRFRLGLSAATRNISRFTPNWPARLRAQPLKMPRVLAVRSPSPPGLGWGRGATIHVWVPGSCLGKRQAPAHPPPGPD